MKNLNNKLENRLNRKIVDKLYVQITKNQDSELRSQLDWQLHRKIRLKIFRGIVWKMSDKLLIKQLKNKLKDGKSK
jgi:hypothetical protein